MLDNSVAMTVAKMGWREHLNPNDKGYEACMSVMEDLERNYHNTLGFNQSEADFNDLVNNILEHEVSLYWNKEFMYFAHEVPEW